MGDESESKGAVLNECAILLPILLVLCMGTLELGGILKELTWAGRIAYQSALLAGETQGPFRSEKAIMRAGSMLQLLNNVTRKSPISHVTYQVVPSTWTLPGTTQERESVSFTLSGQQSLVSSYIDSTFTEQFVAPVVILDETTTAQSDGFSNPGNGYYDCDNMTLIQTPRGSCP